MAMVTSYFENQKQAMSDYYEPDACHSTDQQAYEASHTIFELKHSLQSTPFESAMPRTEVDSMPNHYSDSILSCHQPNSVPSHNLNLAGPKPALPLSLEPPPAVFPRDSQPWIYESFIDSVDPNLSDSTAFNYGFNCCDDREDFATTYANFQHPQWPNQKSQPQRESRWPTGKQAGFQDQIFAKNSTLTESFSSNNVPEIVGSSLVSPVPSPCSYPSPKTKTEPHGIVDSVAMNNDEADVEEKTGDIPYAKLIYSALMDAPGHKLVLRQIYNWIKENTNKGKDPATRGWQNSVRHNLSMNGAFTKVPYTSSRERPKNGYIWVLEPSAIVNGIQSTTRFRRKDNSKRTSKHALGATLQKQSGRKALYAARKVARSKRVTRSDRFTNVQCPGQKVRGHVLNSTTEIPSQSHQSLRLYGEENLSDNIFNGRHCCPTSPFRNQSSIADSTSNHHESTSRACDAKLEEGLPANDYGFEKLPMSIFYGEQEIADQFSGVGLDSYPPY